MLAEVMASEWARLVAMAARMLDDLGEAEDVTQEVFTTAAWRWADGQLPDKPAAWLTVAVRNRCLDRLRRQRRDRGRESLVAVELPDEPSQVVDHGDGSALDDDRLRLVFLCCDARLSPPEQIALSLRLVCGLGVSQIAAAFLVDEAAMYQRLTRAKRVLRQSDPRFGSLDDTAVRERLPSVLGVIYLLFTDGYRAAASSDLQRPAVTARARDLAELMTELLDDAPEAWGLRALIELQSSRERSRVSEAGDVIVLKDQDRTTWDAEMIEAGERSLAAGIARVRGRHAIGPYLVQAAIAARHSRAVTFEATRWDEIVTLYDELLRLKPSPVVALNRAIALGYATSPQSGLTELDALAHEPSLRRYSPLPAARGDLLRRAGRWTEAAAAFEEAAALTTNSREQSFFQRRQAFCTAHANAATQRPHP